MTTLIRPSNPLPILLKSIAFSLIGAATLTFSSPSAHAGAAELKALNDVLTPEIGQATSQQLFDAFKAVIAQAKFDKTTAYGVVAGEALKAAGPNALDAGSFFANALLTDTDPNVVDARAALSTFISLAAKTAGTGKGLNVIQIPDLTAGLLTGTPAEIKAAATVAAENAKNKPGSGAIIGGGASLLADDAAKTTFANEALLNKKLSAGAQDIVQWIAAEVADTSSYAVNVANANFKIAVKVAVGAVAGDSTNAGNIVHDLLNQQQLDDTNGTLSNSAAVASLDTVNAIIKGVSTLVKSAAAAADIEEIQKIGNAFGQAIGTPSAANPLKGQILLSKAGSIVKGLATAVMNKPRTDRFGAAIAANQDANKRDEIAEVSSYVLGGLIGSPELSFNVNNADPKKAASAAAKAATTILALITNATSVKPKLVAKVAQGPTADTFAADVAASVAWTVLNSTLAQNVKDAVKTLLLKVDAKGNPTTAAKINKLAAAQIKAALDNVYAAVPVNPARYENGNDPLGAVSDPETDSHPFS